MYKLYTIAKNKTGICGFWHDENGKCELWFSNKNHASYGIKYKNTDLEFCRSI
jgi:hypothetical protein